MTQDNLNIIDTLPSPLQLQVFASFDQLALTADETSVWNQTVPQGQLLQVLAASPFAAQVLSLNEAWLDYDELTASYTKSGLAESLHAQVAEVASELQLQQCLRQFRKRHQVRLIWRNRCRLGTSAELVQELSNLADVCVASALQWLHHDSVKQWGQPMGHDGQPQSLLVLGMGKLGGGELNLSSDIDLIFSYPEGGETQGGKRSIDNQQFFIRLGQRLIQTIDTVTADGFVFRVDMRLRPYGSSGALALSFDAMEIYYQQQGREWERYAFIKARVIAGNGMAGAQLINLLRPFVYRRYLDFSAIESLRSLKQMIASEVRRRGLQQNVKLGTGGIREVEFIAQAFQLIRGGRDQRLQTTSLMAVLNLLPECAGLDSADVEQLRQHYWFLRDVEHALQAVQDQQTQDLPEQALERARVAFALGFVDWQSLQQRIDHARSFIHQQFELVVEVKEDVQSLTPGDQLTHLWQQITHASLANDQMPQHTQWQAILATAGFADAHRSLQHLWELHQSRAAQMMQPIAQERLAMLMPQILCLAAQHTDPAVTLSRVLVLIEAVLRRSVYLVLLLENPSALRLLVELCAASSWFADFLARQPSLLDELLDVNSLFNVPDAVALKQELEQNLLRLPEDDTEQLMEALRHFKHAHLLRIAANEVTGRLTLMQVSDQLTFVAEAVMGQVMHLAWRELGERHGNPQNQHGPCDDFIVVGYGKVGGWELSYGSDLDLVFVYDMPSQMETDGSKPVANSVFFTRLGQRMINYLNTVTGAGQLYEVDMRLRPDGAKGLLVSSLTAFTQYQLHEAWTWEHQALVRARPIAGSQSLAQAFLKVRQQVLSQPKDPQELRQQVVTMRNKMRQQLATKPSADGKVHEFHLKQDEGGIVDIEFMVQYAVLAHGQSQPKLLTHTDNIRILEGLELHALMPAEQAHNLREAYQLMRSVEHRLTLQNQAGKVSADDLFEQRQMVKGIWQQMMTDCSNQ
ncbi:MAG TPA: bifunctional [glutamate--ammonia ligase]-adenylyl-L-tyrosine phosphorylase/[glutamate--ammonia-ligase] adenylyltransferase [Oceanospirillaceae bacterium]|nr:bifunctional [glutamate--ammonia ligase]-adenylyl-L-tyrosine phosphorylase/[glutamate--ammonia-ligase] adenylyltransferase [Oceanospirillaceae bacterium]